MPKCINFEHCQNTMVSQGVIEDDILLCHHCYTEHQDEFKELLV